MLRYSPLNWALGKKRNLMLPKQLIMFFALIYAPTYLNGGGYERKTNLIINKSCSSRV